MLNFILIFLAPFVIFSRNQDFIRDPEFYMTDQKPIFDPIAPINEPKTPTEIIQHNILKLANAKYKHLLTKKLVKNWFAQTKLRRKKILSKYNINEVDAENMYTAILQSGAKPKDAKSLAILEAGDIFASLHESGHFITAFLTNTSSWIGAHLSSVSNIYQWSMGRVAKAKNESDDQITIPACFWYHPKKDIVIETKSQQGGQAQIKSNREEREQSLNDMTVEELEREMIVTMGGIAADNLLHRRYTWGGLLNKSIKNNSGDSDTDIAVMIARKLAEKGGAKYGAKNPKLMNKHLRNIVQSGYNSARILLERNMVEWFSLAGMLEQAQNEGKFLEYEDAFHVILRDHPDWKYEIEDQKKSLQAIYQNDRDLFKKIFKKFVNSEF